MSVADESVLRKVVERLAEPPPGDASAGGESALRLAAGAYASRPVGEEITVPTGFDPHAAALFEAMVEAAFLVASADGEFDDTEREAFERVVSEASGKIVVTSAVHALLADLADQLGEDGLDARIGRVAASVDRPDRQREVLRVAAHLAHVSGGVSDVERVTIEKIAASFGLGAAAADDALRDAADAIGR